MANSGLRPPPWPSDTIVVSVLCSFPEGGVVVKQDRGQRGFDFLASSCVLHFFPTKYRLCIVLRAGHTAFRVMYKTSMVPAVSSCCKV